MVVIHCRSTSAGWTIIAASTPSKAPRSTMKTLPPPPSSAGVPRMTTRPPTSSARAAAARPGAETGGGDDVVSARMADAGQGVVLEQHGHGRAVDPGPGREGGVEPVGVALDREPLLLEQAGEEVVGVVLGEVLLGMVVDLVGGGDQGVGPPVDLRADPGLGLLEIHRTKLPPGQPGPGRNGRQHVGLDDHGERVRLDVHHHLGGRPDRHPVEEDRHAAAGTTARPSPERRVRRPGWGRWVPVRARRRAVSRSRRPELTLGEIEQAVAGVGTGTEVEVTQPLGVHGHDEPSAPGPVVGGQVGDEVRGGDRRAGHSRGRPGRSWPPRCGVGPRRPGRRGCGRGRHRADRAAGSGDQPRRASFTTAAASASVRTTTPSGGRAPGSPYGLPFSMVTGQRPRPDRRPPGRSRRRCRRCRRLRCRRSGPAVAGADGRRRGHHAPVDGVGGPPGGGGGDPVGGGVAELAQEVDELLDGADEVAARELLVGQDVVEVVARGPRVGQREEGGIGHAGRGEAEAALVGVQLDGQLGQALGPMGDGRAGEPRLEIGTGVAVTRRRTPRPCPRWRSDRGRRAAPPPGPRRSGGRSRGRSARAARPAR